MKIPTPKKLPSGNWMIQVMINGKRINKVFRTKNECIRYAVDIKTEKANSVSFDKLTIGKAADQYIELKRPVLSPSTIFYYKKIRKNLMNGIADLRIADINADKVQQWINELSQSGKAPKTIHNAHGFLYSILSKYDITLKTTLPQRIPADINIPSEHEAMLIAEYSVGTKYELPIKLAMYMGLRVSEILGLQWNDYDGTFLKIRRAIVTGENGEVEKSTKTISGNRILRVPMPIKTLLDNTEHTDAHITNLSSKAIYNGFCRICKKANVPHFRFHDLRHFYASLMLAEGIPNKYSMRQMGHVSDNMLKKTYQHIIKEKEIEYDKILNQKIESLANFK